MKSMHWHPVLFTLIVIILASSAGASPSLVSAGEPSAPEGVTLKELDRRVSNIESRFPVDTGMGGIAFLYGVVCALWATNSGRNPWLWFFFGLFLSIIAALVMLYQNGRDKCEPHSVS